MIVNYGGTTTGVMSSFVLTPCIGVVSSVVLKPVIRVELSWMLTQNVSKLSSVVVIRTDNVSA